MVFLGIVFIAVTFKKGIRAESLFPMRLKLMSVGKQVRRWTFGKRVTLLTIAVQNVA